MLDQYSKKNGKTVSIMYKLIDSNYC